LARIAFEIEFQKEGKIATVQSQRGEHVRLRMIHGAVILGEIENSKGHRDSDTDHHLCQLNNSHQFPPSRAMTRSRQKVIKIHDTVNKGIHASKDGTGRSKGGHGEPCVHQHSRVVIPVQQVDWAFTQNEEERVQQFEVLGEGEEPQEKEAVALVVVLRGHAHKHKEAIISQELGDREQNPYEHGDG